MLTLMSGVWSAGCTPCTSISPTAQERQSTKRSETKFSGAVHARKTAKSVDRNTTIASCMVRVSCPPTSIVCSSQLGGFFSAGSARFTAAFFAGGGLGSAPRGGGQVTCPPLTTVIGRWISPISSMPSAMLCAKPCPCPSSSSRWTMLFEYIADACRAMRDCRSVWPKIVTESLYT